MSQGIQQPTLFPEAAFVGWHRREGERWKPVVAGDTDAEAFRQLQAFSSQPGAHDLLVLPAGKSPTGRKS